MQKKIYSTAVTKVCLNCGKEYLCNKSNADNSKYCSKNCQYEYRSKTDNRKGKHLICKNCGKEFYACNKRAKIAMFCGRDCMYEYKVKTGESLTGQTKICECCGKEFYVENYRKDTARFCSEVCAMTTKKTIRDTRNRMNLAVRVRHGIARPSTLRKFVFNNKPKICEHCNTDYSDYDFCLDVHHKDKNCNNNDLSNLIVLCCICHRKLHKGVIKLEGEL